MSSLEIAELCGKRHDSVKRTIETLVETGVITLPQFVEVSNPGPGPKKIEVYKIGKRDSYVIVAQLSPKFTGALVDRWQELETAARRPTQATEAPPLPSAARPKLRFGYQPVSDDQYKNIRSALKRRIRSVLGERSVGTRAYMDALNSAYAILRHEYAHTSSNIPAAYYENCLEFIANLPVGMTVNEWRDRQQPATALAVQAPTDATRERRKLALLEAIKRALPLDQQPLAEMLAEIV